MVSIRKNGTLVSIECESKMSGIVVSKGFGDINSVKVIRKSSLLPDVVLYKIGAQMLKQIVGAIMNQQNDLSDLPGLYIPFSFNGNVELDEREGIVVELGFVADAPDYQIKVDEIVLGSRSSSLFVVRDLSDAEFNSRNYDYLFTTDPVSLQGVVGGQKISIPKAYAAYASVFSSGMSGKLGNLYSLSPSSDYTIVETAGYEAYVIEI